MSLDLTVAKCLIGQRSISRAVYDGALQDLIKEVEELRAEVSKVCEYAKPGNSEHCYCWDDGKPCCYCEKTKGEMI